MGMIISSVDVYVDNFWGSEVGNPGVVLHTFFKILVHEI
jgi:hypothetical protein